MHNISNDTLTPLCPIPDFIDAPLCLTNIEIDFRYPEFKKGNLTQWKKEIKNACGIIEGEPLPSFLTESCKGNITQLVEELCQDSGKNSFTFAKDISRYCSHMRRDQLSPLMLAIYLLVGTIIGVATFTGGGLLAYRLIHGKNSYQSLK